MNPTVSYEYPEIDFFVNPMILRIYVLSIDSISCENPPFRQKRYES